MLNENRVFFNMHNFSHRDALKVSKWCKDQELVLEKDYKWWANTAEQHFIFEFKDKNNAMLAALKWL